jgi:hypothetical protein
LTPRELKLIFAGAQRRLDREHNRRTWQTWHLARFMRMKRLPSLERIMVQGHQDSKPRQTWQEQLRIMEMWAARQQQAIEMRKADG